MSDYTLVIGNKNYSSWSLRPWLWMKQAGIPFTETLVPLYTDTYKDELQPYFSNYKVPVLLDGDLAVWDTAAILEYLAEKHPDANGWPTDSRARAVARSVSAEMHSSFTALREAMPLNCRKQFPEFKYDDTVQQDVDRISEVWAYCREEFGQDGPWLFGNFSIADAMYAPVVLRFQTYDVALPSFPREYVNTMLENPHVIEWVEAGKKEVEIISQSEV
ncbi:MAG: glutathione S-transferase family protein [Acidiferrobacterales bacterium]